MSVVSEIDKSHKKKKKWKSRRRMCTSQKDYKRTGIFYVNIMKIPGTHYLGNKQGKQLTITNSKKEK